MVSTLDAVAISDRQAVRIISAVVQALGFKLKDLVISRSTIQRIRTKNREKQAKIIKETFKVSSQIYDCFFISYIV